jgi:glutamate-1-semialdehyde aminotransferase
VLHVGTFNGNPLYMAAAQAVLHEICTPDETARTIARNTQFVADCQAILSEHGLPAHAEQCGAQGCVTWLVSVVHDEADLAHALKVLVGFVETLTDPSIVDGPYEVGSARAGTSSTQRGAALGLDRREGRRG